MDFFLVPSYNPFNKTTQGLRAHILNISVGGYMKKLLVLLALVSTSAFALPYNAKSMSGDKVHFQKASTWVNSYYSKSLCFDGTDFHAVVRKCAEWETSDDNRRCVKYINVNATQPQESTRQRCSSRQGGEDDRCTEWETVRYFQSENKTIKFYRDEDMQDLVKTVKITVPSCN